MDTSFRALEVEGLWLGRQPVWWQAGVFEEHERLALEVQGSPRKVREFKDTVDQWAQQFVERRLPSDFQNWWESEFPDRTQQCRLTGAVAAWSRLPHEGRIFSQNAGRESERSTFRPHSCDANKSLNMLTINVL